MPMTTSTIEYGEEGATAVPSTGMGSARVAQPDCVADTQYQELEWLLHRRAGAATSSGGLTGGAQERCSGTGSCLGSPG